MPLNNRFSFASLRTRLISLVFLCVLPVLGLTLYTDVEERRAERAQAREHVLRLTEIAAAHEDQLLQGARQLLRTLAQLPEVRSGDLRGCSAFNDLLKYYPLYANSGVVESDGNVFCSAVPFIWPINADNHSWFQRAIKKRDFAVGDYHICGVSSKAVIVFSYPVLNTAGEVQSVVFVALDLDWLKQLAVKVQLAEGAALLVIDRNGTILAHYPDPEKWVGQSAPDAPIIKAMLTQGKDVAEVHGVDGIQRLYAFTPLSDLTDTDVYMAIGLSQAEPFAEANRTLIRNLTGLGLVTALAIATAWVGGDLFVLRPVNKLVSSTKRIAAGDLSTRTALPEGLGELSQLSLAFNNMAESLERHSSELQQVEAEYVQLLAREQKARAEAEVVQQHFHDLVQGLDAIVTEVDAVTWQFSFVSQRAEAILGYPVQRWLSEPDFWVNLVHPDDLEEAVAYCQEATLQGCNHEFEYRALAADGRIVWLRDIVRVVLDGEGRPQQLHGLMVDITEQKRVEAEIRQLTETLEQRVRERTAQLEAANKELDSFAYSVSHDLRAPLRHIKGFVNALAQQLQRSGAIAEPTVEHYIEVIQDSSQRMGQLVDGLLTLSRVGRQQTTERPVELRPLVENAIALVVSHTQIGEERPIEFMIGDLPTLMGDQTLLQQVFSNLIDNAVKFSRDRHPAKINIGTLPDGTIFVKDNGVGFQTEYADRLFGAFQRLHSQREFPGTGIGLAIVQRIIHRHGGRIWAESAPNRGATFYFKLRQLSEV